MKMSTAAAAQGTAAAEVAAAAVAVPVPVAAPAAAPAGAAVVPGAGGSASRCSGRAGTERRARHLAAGVPEPSDAPAVTALSLPPPQFSTDFQY